MYAPWNPTSRTIPAARAFSVPAATPLPRDTEIEARIARRHAADVADQINSYGGMGMDSVSAAERKLRVAEVQYMTAHPELFPHKANLPAAQQGWRR